DDADANGVRRRLPVGVFHPGQVGLNGSAHHRPIEDRHRLAAHSELREGFVTARNTRAGLPATIVRGGTSRVTTLPAPTMACSPMTMFDRIVEPDPIEAPARTRVGSTFQSCSV